MYLRLFSRYKPDMTTQKERKNERMNEWMNGGCMDGNSMWGNYDIRRTDTDQWDWTYMCRWLITALTSLGLSFCCTAQSAYQYNRRAFLYIQWNASLYKHHVLMCRSINVYMHCSFPIGHALNGNVCSLDDDGKFDMVPTQRGVVTVFVQYAGAVLQQLTNRLIFLVFMILSFIDLNYTRVSMTIM